MVPRGGHYCAGRRVDSVIVTVGQVPLPFNHNVTGACAVKLTEAAFRDLEAMQGNRDAGFDDVDVATAHFQNQSEVSRLNEAYNQNSHDREPVRAVVSNYQNGVPVEFNVIAVLEDQE